MLDELRKKKLLKRMQRPGVMEGFEAKKRYSEVSGRSMEELDAEEAEGAEGGDFVLGEKSKITRESSGQQVGRRIPRSNTLDYVRKPMYDALADEEEERKRKALEALGRGKK